MKEMNNRYKELLDMTTGEVIQVPAGFVDNRADYSIRHKNQDKAYQDRLQRAEDNFYWGMLPQIEALLKGNKLSLTSLGMLLVLGCQLQNDTDMLCTQKKTALIKQELIELTGTTDRTFERSIKELVECGVVYRQGTKKSPVYHVNQQFHFIGKNRQANQSVRIFKSGIVALKNSGLKLDEIGFIYAVLPFIDYKRCTLVKDRENGEEIENLHDVESLCEALNITKKTLLKYLKLSFVYSFKDGDFQVPIFGNFSACGSKKKAYTVNPLLLRRTIETDINYKRFESLADMFKIYRKRITE